MSLKATSKNNIPAELEVAAIVNSLVERYAIPIYTENIVIESKVISHSRPILTINTRTKEPLLLLQVLIHEQLHWWVDAHPRYAECLEMLKTKYRDDGEHNKSGTYPNSYWEHIIVCFNTKLWLEKILTKRDVEWIYQQWQAYPTLERFITNRKKEIGAALEKYDMVLKM